MGLREEYFWASTPRKIVALIDQKNEIETIKAKNLAIYIACYVWGKNPEEVDQKDKPLVGVDVPAPASLVAMMF